MTKSYNYIPTHFLYSSLLFFLLIFMYQQIHCHTLPFHFPKFFSSEFMYQPYTAPTLTPTRPASGLHTSPRPSSHTNQSTNDTVHTTTLHKYHNHTASTPIQPPQKHTTTLHKYHNHTASAPIQPHKPIHQRPRTHKHTPQIPHPHSPTTTQRHKRTHDAAQAHRRRRRRRRTDVVALAATRQSAIRQARHQTGSGHTKPDRTGSGHTKPDRPRTEPDRTGTGHDLTGRIQDQIEPD